MERTAFAGGSPITNDITIDVTAQKSAQESAQTSASSEAMRIRVLDDVSFHVESAHSAAVIGPSGSGKTTLLSLTAGLDTADSGDVILVNTNLSQATEEARTAFRLENIGFVFQNFELIQTLSALENVMVPAELKGNAHSADLASSLLEEVGLGNRLQHTPSELSGGERQRVAIARAFVNEPNILLADEPTGNLDRETGARIIDLLFKLNEEKGTTLLVATHDVHLAERCQHQFEFESTGLLKQC